ncbi:MAG: YcjX family protein [Pontiellaceae bacterium]|nr:YcjX family protein [Pontiellaceae bacterium]
MQIGITGIANGGKTVFLSSLLWQLAEIENADDFSLGKIKLSGFRDVSGHGKEAFPFEKFRDSLSRNGQWPEKTTDSFRAICEFHRSDWNKLDFRRLKRLGRLQHNDVQKLEFFDFAGERIADAAIAAFDNYAEWSAHMLQHFESHADYRAAAMPFMQHLENLSDETEAAEIIHAYKLVLAGLAIGYKPLVSPSVFLLGRDGSAAGIAPDRALAASRLSGLDEEHQFAPLSAAAMEACPKLAVQMARNYKKYRRNVAAPLFEEIGKSRRLVVLVDIPSLLAGGVGRYNDNRQIVLDLFDALRPNSSIGAKLLNLLTFWKGGLEKVAFVAVKSDLVHPDDIKNGRVESLLRQMTVKAKGMLPNVEFGWFVCSAIQSTRSGNTSNTLIGRPAVNNQEKEEREFTIPTLPENWPGNWSPGDFRFTSVLPAIHPNLQVPPKQFGMDRVFRFLIEE